MARMLTKRAGKRSDDVVYERNRNNQQRENMSRYYSKSDPVVTAIFMILVGCIFAGFVVYLSWERLGSIDQGLLQRITDIIHNVSVTPDDRSQIMICLGLLGFSALLVVIGTLILIVKSFTERKKVIRHLEGTALLINTVISIILFILSYQAITTDIQFMQYTKLVENAQTTTAQIVDHRIMPERTAYYFYDHGQLIEYRSYPLFGIKYTVDGKEYRELLSGMETKIVGKITEERNPSHTTDLKEDLHIVYDASSPSRIHLADDLLVRDLQSDTPPDYQHFYFITLLLVLSAVGTLYGSGRWLSSILRRSDAVASDKELEKHHPKPASNDSFSEFAQDSHDSSSAFNEDSSFSH